MALNFLTSEVIVCGTNSIAVFKLDYVGREAPFNCPNYPQFSSKSQGATLVKRKSLKQLPFASDKKITVEFASPLLKKNSWVMVNNRSEIVFARKDLQVRTFLPPELEGGGDIPAGPNGRLTQFEVEQKGETVIVSIGRNLHIWAYQIKQFNTDPSQARRKSSFNILALDDSTQNLPRLNSEFDIPKHVQSQHLAIISQTKFLVDLIHTHKIELPFAATFAISSELNLLVLLPSQTLLSTRFKFWTTPHTETPKLSQPTISVGDIPAAPQVQMKPTRLEPTSRRGGNKGDSASGGGQTVYKTKVEDRFRISFLQEWIVVYDNYRLEISYFDLSQNKCFHRKKLGLKNIEKVSTSLATPNGGVFLLNQEGVFYDYSFGQNGGLGVITQGVSITRPYRMSKPINSISIEPHLDVCIFPNGAKCILVMRAYTIQIYEYGARGSMFLKAPQATSLNNFEIGFDGTVMVKTANHELYSLSDGGSIVGKYKILKEIGSYIHDKQDESQGMQKLMKSAPPLRRMKNKSIAQFDADNSENSLNLSQFKSIPQEGLAFTDVNEELRVMTAIYQTGNLYIGNYEVKAAVEMDTLMNSPICMKVFRSYFQELSEGKHRINSDNLSVEELDIRLAQHQFSVLILSQLGYMKLLIFAPQSGQFFQNFCDIKKEIKHAQVKHSKVFSITTDGLIYVHQVRSFSSLVVLCALWEDASCLHLSSEDILVGYSSGLILSIPIKFYKPETVTTPRSKATAKKSSPVLFRPKITLLDEDYRIFSFYHSSVISLQGEYSQFVALYQNHRIVLWDKNFKLPMYQLFIVGTVVKDMFVTESNPEMISHVLLLTEKYVIEIQPQYEFVLHNNRLTSSDWENLIYENTCSPSSSSRQIWKMGMLNQISSDVESILVNLHLFKRDRKLNKSEAEMTHFANNFREPRLHQCLLKMTQACYYRVCEYEAAVILTEAICKGTHMLGEVGVLHDCNYLKDINLRHAWKCQMLRTKDWLAQKRKRLKLAKNKLKMNILTSKMFEEHGDNSPLFRAASEGLLFNDPQDPILTTLRNNTEESKEPEEKKEQGEETEHRKGQLHQIIEQIIQTSKSVERGRGMKEKSSTLKRSETPREGFQALVTELMQKRITNKKYSQSGLDTSSEKKKTVLKHKSTANSKEAMALSVRMPSVNKSITVKERKEEDSVIVSPQPAFTSQRRQSLGLAISPKSSSVTKPFAVQKLDVKNRRSSVLGAELDRMSSTGLKSKYSIQDKKLVYIGDQQLQKQSTVDNLEKLKQFNYLSSTRASRMRKMPPRNYLNPRYRNNRIEVYTETDPKIQQAQGLLSPNVEARTTMTKRNTEQIEETVAQHRDSDLKEVLKQKEFGFQMLESLNPLRRQNLPILKNPKEAVQQLRDIYFKDIKNYLSLASSLQRHLNLGFSGVPIIEEERMDQSSQSSISSCVINIHPSNEEQLDTPRQNEKMKNIDALDFQNDPDDSMASFINPYKGITQNQNLTIAALEGKSSMSTSFLIAAQSRPKKIHPHILQHVIQESLKRNKRLFTEMSEYLSIENPLEFAHIAPNDIYWPIYIPNKDLAYPQEQIEILESNHIHNLTSARHIGYCRINTNQLLHSIQENQISGGGSRRDGSLFDIQSKSAQLQQALSKLNPWLYNMLLPQYGAQFLGGGQKSETNKSRPMNTAQRLFGGHKRKMYLYELFQQPNESFLTQEEYQNKPMFLLVGKKQELADPNDPRTTPIQMRYRFAFYTEKVRMEHFIRFSIVPYIIRSALAQIDEKEKQRAALKPKFPNIRGIIREDDIYSSDNLLGANSSNYLQNPLLEILSNRGLFGGSFIDRNEPMNPELQGRTRAGLQPSNWEERHYRLLKSAEAVRKSAVQFGSFKELQEALLDKDQLFNSKAKLTDEAELVKLIVLKGLQAQENEEDKENSEEYMKRKMRRMSELIEESLAEMGVSGASQEIERNEMMNQVARALGNLSPQKQNEEEIGSLFNTMIYSKSHEEVMSAAKKFLQSQRVDFSQFMNSFHYEEEIRRKEEEDIEPLHLFQKEGKSILTELEQELDLHDAPSLPNMEDLVHPTFESSHPHLENESSMGPGVPYGVNRNPLRKRKITLEDFFSDLRMKRFHIKEDIFENGEFFPKVLTPDELLYTKWHVSISEKEKDKDYEANQRIAKFKEQLTQQQDRIKKGTLDLHQNNIGYVHLHNLKRTPQPFFEPALMTPFRENLMETLNSMSDFGMRLRRQTVHQKGPPKILPNQISEIEYTSTRNSPPLRESHSHSSFMIQKPSTMQHSHVMKTSLKDIKRNANSNQLNPPNFASCDTGDTTCLSKQNSKKSLPSTHFSGHQVTKLSKENVFGKKVTSIRKSENQAGKVIPTDQSNKVMRSLYRSVEPPFPRLLSPTSSRVETTEDDDTTAGSTEKGFKSPRYNFKQRKICLNFPNFALNSGRTEEFEKLRRMERVYGFMKNNRPDYIPALLSGRGKRKEISRLPAIVSPRGKQR